MQKVKTFEIEDEFLKANTEYRSDACISIKRQFDTLGNVMCWMAAYDQDDFDKLTIKNYRHNHSESNMDLRNRYPDGTVITGGGSLCFYGPRNEYKAGIDGKRYPLETPFIDIIADYAEKHWNNEVYIISYYSGLQGLLATTVFDKKDGALFSFTSLEMYGDWRAR